MHQQTRLHQMSQMLVLWMWFMKFLSALVDLRRAVAGRLGQQVAEEHTPVQDPQSNGAIECGVKQLKGMIRALYMALEHRIQGVIPVTHPTILWLVEHTTELLAKCQMGHAGKRPTSG